MIRILRGREWGRTLQARLPLDGAPIGEWMARHARLLKSDTFSRVGLLEVDGRPCCLKLYLPKSRLQAAGFRLGRGRGRRAFDAAAALAAAGLPVPEPRCCLLTDGGMLLLTAEIARARDLRSLWLDAAGTAPVAGLLPTAGATLAALHRAGFAHGDCKWSNLLAAGDRLYLVDLEAVRRVRLPADRGIHRRQLRDLARFTVEAEELGVSPGQFESALGAYLAASATPQDRLLAGLRPLLAAIRERHRRRYGLTPAPLL